MEKYELSARELEAQSVELLPDRMEMVRGGGRVRLGADVRLGRLAEVEALIEIGVGSGSGGAG